MSKKCFNINPMPDSISLLTDQDCCLTFVCSFFVACTFFVCFDSTRMTPDILQRKLSRLNFHWYSILIHVQWAVADHRRMIPILNFNKMKNWSNWQPFTIWYPLQFFALVGTRLPVGLALRATWRLRTFSSVPSSTCVPQFTPKNIVKLQTNIFLWKTNRQQQ